MEGMTPMQWYCYARRTFGYTPRNAFMSVLSRFCTDRDAYWQRVARVGRERAGRFAWSEGDLTPISEADVVPIPEPTVYERRVGDTDFDIEVWPGGRWAATKAGESEVYLEGQDDGYEDEEAHVTDITWDLFSKLDQEHGWSDREEGFEQADIDKERRRGL